MFKRITLGIILALVLSALVIGSWSARNNEIVFNADIARDFLLYDSLTEDPIMLIGPRADYKGLFHGPAWLYINFPAYVVGQGNPVAISYYWILMVLGGAALNYWVGMKLFDKLTGFIFSAFTVFSGMYFVNQFYNPTGAMFLMPLFVYCAYQYYKTQGLKFMMAQLFLAGMILQFQLAAGIPVIILSTLALLATIVRHKNWKHLWGFAILLIPLSTFIVYELRFGFPQFNAILTRFTGNEVYFKMDFWGKLDDRMSRIAGPGLGFFEGKYGHFNRYVGVGMVAAMGYLLINKKTKEKGAYGVGLYYFIGFYILSFIHSGSVVLHYYVPFIFIPLLLFSSLHRYLNKKLFLVLVIIIMGINVSHLYDRQQEFAEKKGTYFTSWTSFQEIISTVEDSVEGEEVGVFVYAPDTYSYGPKYAALYMQRTFKDTAVVINEKKPETYLIYEQSPIEQPWLNGEYWKSDLVNINAKPVDVITTEAGYKIEKYLLDEEDIDKPVDPLALDWVSQR